MDMAVEVDRSELAIGGFSHPTGKTTKSSFADVIGYVHSGSCLITTDVLYPGAIRR